MSVRPDNKRGLQEALGSPPLGVLLLVLFAVYLCLGYLLTGLTQLSTDLGLALGWFGLGLFHLIVAYGLGRSHSWAWGFSILVFSANLVIAVVHPYQDLIDYRMTVLYLAILGYLVIQRDAIAVSNEA